MGSGALRGPKVATCNSPVHHVDSLDVGRLVSESRAVGSRSSWSVVDCAAAEERSFEVAPQEDLLLCLERAQCRAGRTRAGQISARAMLERPEEDVEDGKSGAPGRVLEWPAKRCKSSPAWFSAKPLGGSAAELRGVSLRIELWERRRLLGSFSSPLDSALSRTGVAEKLDSGGCGVSFRLLPLVPQRRTVFFVRHAQSVWNEAQQKLQVHKLLGSSDHPLSATGRAQAEELASRLQRGLGEVAAEPFFSPGAVFSSPLTRALQTAVIALGGIAMKPGKLLLMANAREKQNMGGRDTRSTKTGTEILQNTLQELRKLYEGREAPALRDFARLRYDLEEVRECWWCADTAEGEAQLAARLGEFMAQLLYSPHETVIVVGHSHFFREVFRRFLSEELKERQPGLAGEAQQLKMENCGVVRVDLDPRRGVDGGPITELCPVLGTRFVGPEKAPQPVSSGKKVAPASALEFNALLKSPSWVVREGAAAD